MIFMPESNPSLDHIKARRDAIHALEDAFSAAVKDHDVELKFENERLKKQLERRT